MIQRLRPTVAGLFVLELVQTALMTHYAWKMLIGNWGRTDSLSLPWSSATFSPLIGLSELLGCYHV
jgi:hypothetical protein